MEYIRELEEIQVMADMIKICFISLCTYYIGLRLTRNTMTLTMKRIIFMGISIVLISVMSKWIKSTFGFFYSIISQGIFVSLWFAQMTKNKFIYSMFIICISLTINYILYSISIWISFFLFFIIQAKNDYVNISIIIFIYILFVYRFVKIRKLEKGISFFQKKLNDEYLDISILNISSIILLTIMTLSNFSEEIAKTFGIALILFIIIMFVTIQKSLQLYYKHNLLVQELKETKQELDKKKQEIEELENENLNFSKISHSIIHKQKSLEYKLDKLTLKSEIGMEADITNRLKNITKELQTEIIVELVKTNITEIDDMLSYMQSECRKNKIDFQVQITGKIQYMINHYISREKLEILIADHIRNAIIAIQHADNQNKSILVRLGIIEGVYSLYIYDSGIEFEQKILTNLGKKPSTTHADEGGTGMGFMHTFDTLKQVQASMIIQEYGKPCLNNFTKVIKIKFDQKNQFEILTYRKEEE